MLRSDATRDGPFWKLSQGHSEWEQTHDALENRDRSDLWHKHSAETTVAKQRRPMLTLSPWSIGSGPCSSRLSAQPTELGAP